MQTPWFNDRLSIQNLWQIPPNRETLFNLSGHQPGLPPLRPRFNPEVTCGVSLGRSQSDSEGFSPGTSVFLPPQNRLPVNYICLGQQCSEMTHGSYGGNRAAPSHAFDPIPLSRLIQKSPCRERSTKHIYIYVPQNDIGHFVTITRRNIPT